MLSAPRGHSKGHYYHGELVGQERVYDNRLLTYLLGKAEHLLQPAGGSLAVCENWEEHMDSLEFGLPAPELTRSEPSAAEEIRHEYTGSEVREDEEGIWWTSFPPPAGFDGEERRIWVSPTSALTARSSRSSMPRSRMRTLRTGGGTRPRTVFASRRGFLPRDPNHGLPNLRRAGQRPGPDGIQVPAAPSASRRDETPRDPPPVIPAKAGTHEHGPDEYNPRPRCSWIPDQVRHDAALPGPHPNRPSPASLPMNHRELVA